MSRRDTIIIAVLINACLLVILFATAVTKKDDLSYSSKNVSPAVPQSPSINIEDVQRTVVKESSFTPSKKQLDKPTMPTQIAEFEKPSIPIPPSVVIKKEVEPPKDTHIQITVKRGDYLDKLARENNTKVDEIMKINSLTSTQLRIGQTLLIPSKTHDESSKNNKTVAKQYVVKSGDTLWQIAKNHNMQVSDLLKMNHMSSDSANRLQPGDTLLVR
ncbi:MAG: hypothetical protein S4CHLAM7_09380 [Chlamydiae bacterium]|nr:hypothetical protein [Chlamydiota bacterium]